MTPEPDMNLVRAQLAPTGVLRAGINLSNFLLVTDRDHVDGVSPALARFIAHKLEGELVSYIELQSPEMAAYVCFVLCVMGA